MSQKQILKQNKHKNKFTKQNNKKGKRKRQSKSAISAQNWLLKYIKE
jgi:hypothetical protein